MSTQGVEEVDEQRHAFGWVIPSLTLLFTFAITSLMTLEFAIDELGLLQNVQIGAISEIISERWHWVASWIGFWSFLSVATLSLTGARRGAVVAGGYAVALSLGLLTAYLLGRFDIGTLYEWGLLVLALWGGWMAIQFGRLSIAWPRLKSSLAENRLNAADNREKVARSFAEFFGYLVMSLLALSYTASQLVWPAMALEQRFALSIGVVPSIMFAAFVAMSFAPLMSAYWLKERFESLSASRSFWRDDVVHPFWLVLITALALGVGALAYFAAKYATQQINAAISYATFLGVLCVFLVVITLPHILNYLRQRSEERHATTTIAPTVLNGVASLDMAAQWVSRIDTFLVRVVAPLSGGTQKWMAHIHVVVILSLLSLLGLTLPRPAGLVPIVIGILLALALGRRWAWVEEDRETASRLERTRGPNIHLGFDNDLKDEALLAYAGLFILVPLTLYQVQDLTNFTPPLVEQRGILLTWVVFFGGELAKAVPFVDWWDIYGNPSLSETGKHLTFLSRAAVDLVILAALFQALSIWQRNRVQTRLYEEGHLDSFDPFREQEFFEHGLVRLKGDARGPDGSGGNDARINRLEKLRSEKRLAPLRRKGMSTEYYEVRASFLDKIELHLDKRQRLLNEGAQLFESAAPYSRRRLSELMTSPNPELRAGANWMIERWDVLVGTPLNQLRQLGLRWQNQNFPKCYGDDVVDGQKKRRIQKVEFERILVELADLQWIYRINRENFKHLMECLLRVRNDVEFDFARILAFELMSRLRASYVVLHLSKFVMRRQDLEQRENWRLRVTAEADGPDPHLRLGRSDMRERVYETLRRIACNQQAGDSARRDALELLRMMSEDDTAQTGQAKAELEASEAERCLLEVDLTEA